MSSTRDSSGVDAGPGEPVTETMVIRDPGSYRTELWRADAVASWLGVELGDAPGGGLVTWELCVEGARVAVTDEPMTDQAAFGWARRTLGEDVVFWPARIGGGYWVADPVTPRAPGSPAAPAVSRVGGWA